MDVLDVRSYRFQSSMGPTEQNTEARLPFACCTAKKKHSPARPFPCLQVNELAAIVAIAVPCKCEKEMRGPVKTMGE